MNQQELFDKVVAIANEYDVTVNAKESDIMSDSIAIESFISSPLMRELLNEMSVFYNDFERSIIVY